MAGAGIEPGTRSLDRSSPFLLLGVLLLGTCLRFNQSGAIPLRADEAANFYLALKPPEAIIHPLVTSDPHLPFFYILLHYWMIVAGSSELSLRFLTIFSSILLVPLVYVFGRRLFPRSNIPLIGAFFTAINPYSIWDSQDAYMYAMLTATGLASFVAFARVLCPNASRLAWATYVVVTTLALYEHYLAGLILIAQGVEWLWLTATRTIGPRTSLGWLAAQIAIAALFAPWLVLAFPLITGLTGPIWQPVSLIELLSRSFIAFSLGRVTGLGMPAMVDPLTGILGAAPFFVLLLLGMLLPRRSSKDDLYERALLTIYLWIPLLAFYAFTLVRFPVYDERYVLFLIPPFSLLLARGLVVLQQRTKPIGIAVFALLIVALLSAHSLFNYWYVPAYAKSSDWPGLVRQLNTEYRAGDVLIQNYPDSALPYYLHDSVPSVLVPGKSPAQMSSVASRMGQLTTEYDRIWFQRAAGNAWDTEGLVATWLGRHALFVRAFSFRDLQLELYVSATSAFENAQVGETLFADDIRLLGFDLNIADESGSATTARVVLFWKALNRADRNETVFLHLYDEKGKLVSQQDDQPVHGSYPTRDWQAGEIVVDSHDLPIPAHLATGEYTVVLGMYDSETKVRVSVVDSMALTLPDNRVILTNLHLK